MSATATIETSRNGGVLTIRMNRPQKRNALDRAMYAGFAAALEDAQADPAIGAVVLAGLPGAFCAGNDIRDFAAATRTDTPLAEVERFIDVLARAAKPLVAAVDGPAVGIGTTMLLHCDLVFASPRASFATPFLELGLVPEAGSSLLAPRLMGHQAAFALLVLGDTFSAEAARTARLVHALDETPEERAGEAAAAFAAKPREALRIARDLVRGPRDDVLARIALESRHFADRLRSTEAQAAFAAFLSR